MVFFGDLYISIPSKALSLISVYFYHSKLKKEKKKDKLPSGFVIISAEGVPSSALFVAIVSIHIRPIYRPLF